MHVWIAQCLCPSRHCIMATAEEAASEAEAVEKVEMPLRQALRDFLAKGELNPWCGLCGAKQESWRYETRRTRYATLREAMPHLRAMEADNIVTAAAFGELHKGRPN